MRDYQRIKNNPYYLQRDVYRLTLAFIRSYPNLNDQLNCALNESPDPPDGMPRGTGTGDPTAQRASKIEPLMRDIRIITNALEVVPEEYREPILESIIKFKTYPLWADRSTFGRWKQRFVYKVYIEKFGYML